MQSSRMLESLNIPSNQLGDPRIAQLVSTLRLFESYSRELASIYRGLFEEGSKSTLEKLLSLVNSLIREAELAPECLLFVCNTAPGRQAPERRAVRAGILTAMLGRRQGAMRRKLVSTVAAALTADIALYRDKLKPQSDEKLPLNHPHLGADILAQNNLEDSLWIESVRNHHEFLDGSGFPSQLTESELKVPARILSIISRFIDYQGSPAEALKVLYLDRGKKIDALLAQQFIKEVGVYPPGSVLILEDNSKVFVWQYSKKSEDFWLLKNPSLSSESPRFSVVDDSPKKRITRTASPEDCPELFQWIADLAAPA